MRRYQIRPDVRAAVAGYVWQWDGAAAPAEPGAHVFPVPDGADWFRRMAEAVLAEAVTQHAGEVVSVRGPSGLPLCGFVPA